MYENDIAGPGGFPPALFIPPRTSFLATNSPSRFLDALPKGWPFSGASFPRGAPCAVP